MEASVLIDNNPHPKLSLLTEHGLSIYFETDGLKWLMDVGASEQFYSNAVSMGINIADIDYLVLSHGHFDHTGGLEHFIKVNKKAQIVMSAHIKGKQFYSYRLQSKRDISIDYSIVEQNINRFTFVDSNSKITENVGLICEIPQKHKTPKGNSKLFQSDLDGEKLDEFKHEIVLAVESPKGVIVFSGCSHNGILNILEACSKYMNNSNIVACLGGTHLIDCESNNINESDMEIKEMGESINRLYPSMKLISGHCTGTNAQKILSETLGNRYSHFYTGFIFKV